MRLVVTDSGYIWNHMNPYLERFKDIVLVVCLSGKAVTDKYECFVSPYKQVGMGVDKYGTEDRKYHALASVAGKLYQQFSYYDDIVFLTDSEPSTLYPFFVVKDINKHMNYHLVAMSPWYFELNLVRKGYKEMMSDLSKLDSILYYDSNEVLEAVGKDSTLPKAYEYARDYLGGIMVHFLNGIGKEEIKKTPSYFDFASMSYVPLSEGFDSIDLTNRDKKSNKILFDTELRWGTLGYTISHMYPEYEDNIKKIVEQPVARLDGKKVCNVLREQRIRLAKANRIPFESEVCPSIGPCAGTCEKCDKEAEYLQKELKKIPRRKRIYPQFNPSEEV